MGQSPQNSLDLQQARAQSRLESSASLQTQCMGEKKPDSCSLTLQQCLQGSRLHIASQGAGVHPDLDRVSMPCCSSQTVRHDGDSLAKGCSFRVYRLMHQPGCQWLECFPTPQEGSCLDKHATQARYHSAASSSPPVEEEMAARVLPQKLFSAKRMTASFLGTPLTS